MVNVKWDKFAFSSLILILTYSRFWQVSVSDTPTGPSLRYSRQQTRSFNAFSDSKTYLKIDAKVEVKSIILDNNYH